MKKTTVISTIGIITALSLAAPSVSISAADGSASQGLSMSQQSVGAGIPGSFSGGPMAGGFSGGPMVGGFGADQTMGGSGEQNGQTEMQGFGNYEIAESASEIVSSDVTCTAEALSADYENAVTIEMSDTDNQVKISEAGTYIVTGSCSNGNITVKKGTTGVVLILKDLELTSTTGATVSVNKGSEAQIVVEGSVTLTDAENPEDENSADEEVADAYDGAVIKVKDGANVYLTGTGSLTVNGSAKNGIKSGDEEGTCLVIDGADITINAANDAINAGYDLTVLSGNITITAVDDAIHADRILTLGSDSGSGPVISINSCTEGLEGTVVNVFSGNISINSSDDAINAANKEATYSSELAYSINISGGTVRISASGDGLDSNGNINLTGGDISIRSASTGGEAGIDFDGAYYISENVSLRNASGVSGPDMMPGQNGQFGQDGFSGNFGPGSSSGPQPGQSGQPGQPGQNSQMGQQFSGNTGNFADRSAGTGSVSGSSESGFQGGQTVQPGQNGQFGQGGFSGNFGLGSSSGPQPGQSGQLGQPGQNGQIGQSGQSGQMSQPVQNGMGGHGGPGGSSSGVTYNAEETISASTTESGKTITTEASDTSALLVNGGTVTENNLKVSKTGSSSGGDSCNFYGLNAAVLAKDGAVLNISSSDIYSNADGANGVFSYGGNGGKNDAAGDGTTVNISDSTIVTEGNSSGGIMTTGGGILNASNLDVTTSGRSSAAIRTDRGGGTVTVDGGTYTTNGLGSPAVYSTADITVKNADLVSNLSEGVVIEGKNTVTLENVNLTANNTKTNSNATHLDTIFLYQSMSGDADSGTSCFSMTGGSLNSLNGEVFHVTNTNAVINLSGVTITNKDAAGTLLTVTNDGWSGSDNTATLNAKGQKLEGNIIVSNTAVKDNNSSKLTLNLTDSSVFEGSINTSEADRGTVAVTLDESSTWKLTADSYVTSVSGKGNIDYNGYTLYVGENAKTTKDSTNSKESSSSDTGSNNETSSASLKNTNKKIRQSRLAKSDRSYSLLRSSDSQQEVSVVKYYGKAAEYITVSSSGSVTVKKGTPAGKYRVKIKVSSADGSEETVKTIKIKVK